MLQTISKKQIEQAAKQYANENPNKYWQEAVDIFKWMSDYLVKENNKSSIDIKFNPGKYTITFHGMEKSFCKKEFKLAYYLYNNSNRIISRDELLENIWGNVCVGDRTVDVHVRKLRSQIPNIPIKSHIGIGYGWIEE